MIASWLIPKYPELCVQTFLSELYVYLVDQMHQSLNKVLQMEDHLIPRLGEGIDSAA